MNRIVATSKRINPVPVLLSLPMPLLLGQLIYTSFAKVGFQALTSAEVPAEIRQEFIEKIVYQHWDAYNPPDASYRAAYLYQVSTTQTLFGWLYNDGTDDFDRTHVPYFMCYYLSGLLESAQLRLIFRSLLTGPIELVDRQSPPEEINSITLPDRLYQSARSGVGIFAPVQEQAYLSVQQGKLFRMFVSEDKAGQSLKFATSVSAKENESSRLEEPKVLSSISDGKLDSAVASKVRTTLNPQDSSKIVDEIIVRSEQEAYQQVLLSKLQADGAGTSIGAWALATSSSEWRKVLIGIAALIALIASGFYLLRLIPRSMVQFPFEIPAGQNSIPGLGNPILAKTFLDTAPVWSVVVSPDKQTVIGSGANQTIKVWNLETGKVLKTLSGHRDVVRSLVLVPDGKTLMSGSGDRTLKIWDLQTNRVIQTLNQGSSVWGLALSPDGKTVFSGGEDGLLRVWQFATGDLLQTIPAHQSQIFSIALSPDGKTVATASFDQTIKVWNAQTGALIKTLTGHVDAVRAVAFSPDGKTLASASWDQTLKLWNWQTGELIRTFTGHKARVVAIVFSPDGQTLISGSVDHRINFWAVQDGTLLRSLSDHTDWILSLSVEPNRLVSSSKDQTIRIWQFR